MNEFNVDDRIIMQNYAPSVDGRIGTVTATPRTAGSAFYTVRLDPIPASIVNPRPQGPRVLRTARDEMRWRDAEPVTALPPKSEDGTEKPSEAPQSRGDALANGERMDEYGSPTVSFNRIADLWTTYIAGVDHKRLTAEDVAMMMVLLKVSRRITDKKADTLDDIEGYIACTRMLEKDAA